MGTGGGTGRAARRIAPALAAVAGATALAAMAGRRWRHRDAGPDRHATLPPGDEPDRARRPIAPSPPPAVGLDAGDQAPAPTAGARVVAEALVEAPAPADARTRAADAPVRVEALIEAPAAMAAVPAVAAPTVDAPAPGPAMDPTPSAAAPGGRPAPSLGESTGGGHMASRRRPRGAVGAVVGVVLVIVLGVGAMVAAGNGGDGSPGSGAAIAGDTGTTGSTTTTTTAPPPAALAFSQAAERLSDAGSFGYTGAARASDVSQARPMLWLAVESTIEGQVDTSTGRVHEVAVATDGTTSETVTDGPLVWGRKASTVEALPDQPYRSVPGLSGDELAVKGMARLPDWLAAAVDPLDAGADGQGRRLYQATVPAEVLGVIERERAPVGATVLLTLDGAGDPVRVELTSAAGGPTFHLVFEVTGLGEPVTITPPGSDTSA